MAEVKRRHMDLAMSFWTGNGHVGDRKVAQAIADAEERERCSGCRETLTEGSATNWCPSGCTCLGAVWCTACWNLHVDRKQKALAKRAHTEVKLEKAEALVREALQYVDECARSSMGAGLVARGIRAHLKEHNGGERHGR